MLPQLFLPLKTPGLRNGREVPDLVELHGINPIYAVYRNILFCLCHVHE
jgi:hypothetical protein